MKRLCCILLVAAMLVGLFPVLEAKAAETASRGTPLTPSDYSQYSDVKGNAEIYLDAVNGKNYLLLRYKDAYSYVYCNNEYVSYESWSDYSNIYMVQAWTDDSGVEYIDCFMWYGYGSPATFGCDADTGKWGMYGMWYWAQFTYSDGELTETVWTAEGNSYGYLLDSYVYDNNYYVMYVKTLTKKGVTSPQLYNGLVLLDKSPSAYMYQYKTTFRFLTEDATVYNTYYYDSCYAADDEIKCIANTSPMSGSTRQCYIESVTLADGASTFILSDNPTLLCQISSYGTAYDIAYTNDSNLCSLLGIDIPAEKVWDVTSQTWKSSSNTSTDSGSSTSIVYDTENLADIEDLSIKLVGVDELIDAITFNNYYAGYIWHENALEDLNANVWGLGNYISWNYDGVTYESMQADETAGSLLTSSKNHRRVKLVVKAKFKLDDSTTKTLSYTLYDYDDTPGIAVGTGSRKISFHDLCLYFQDAYPEYVTDFPTQLCQISYYLTPFYYDADAAEYHYGNTSRITQNVSSALADYSGDEWDDNDDGYLLEDDDPLSTGNILNFFSNIGDAINSVIDCFKDVINDAFRLISYVGQLPALLSSFIPFVPEELWSLLGIGLFLYFAPALLAGIRNLLKLGG